MSAAPTVRLRAGLAVVRAGRIALAPFRCPFRGSSLLIRLHGEDHGVRCIRCAAGSIHLALGDRSHGHDIPRRMRATGFADARLHEPQGPAAWHAPRTVIVACKEGS